MHFVLLDFRFFINSSGLYWYIINLAGLIHFKIEAIVLRVNHVSLVISHIRSYGVSVGVKSSITSVL